MRDNKTEDRFSNLEGVKRRTFQGKVAVGALLAGTIVTGAVASAEPGQPFQLILDAVTGFQAEVDADFEQADTSSAQIAATIDSEFKEVDDQLVDIAASIVGVQAQVTGLVGILTQNQILSLPMIPRMSSRVPAVDGHTISSDAPLIVEACGTQQSFELGNQQIRDFITLSSIDVGPQGQTPVVTHKPTRDRTESGCVRLTAQPDERILAEGTGTSSSVINVYSTFVAEITILGPNP